MEFTDHENKSNERPQLPIGGADFSIENTIARAIRICLRQVDVGGSILSLPSLKVASDALEYYIPDVFRECHPAWRYESLDGVVPTTATKLGDFEVEISGLCILISDQTLAPFHLRLQFDLQSDVINWLECRLGEESSEGMRRIPYDSPDNLYKKLHSMSLAANVDLIDWAYKVTFGNRQAQLS